MDTVQLFGPRNTLKFVLWRKQLRRYKDCVISWCSEEDGLWNQELEGKISSLNIPIGFVPHSASYPLGKADGAWSWSLTFTECQS